jgi:type II secretory ATPase GspE/PulE/Tfp pilus assembly ATPase PilB-like protein
MKPALIQKISIPAFLVMLTVIGWALTETHSQASTGETISAVSVPLVIGQGKAGADARARLDAMQGKTGKRGAKFDAQFSRGPGHYYSLIKIGLYWLLFLLWIKTTSWVNQDCQKNKLDWMRWNTLVFGAFMVFFALSWILPWFWLGFPLLVFAYIVPLILYILFRNQKVMMDEKVMTVAHIRFLLSIALGKVGVKIEAERQAAWQKGPALELFGEGGETERDDRANILAARQLPAFNDARGLLAESLARRGDAVMLEYAKESVTIRYMIDGVWHNDEPQDRETYDPILDVYKTLSGLNPKERRGKQKSAFGIKYDRGQFHATIVCQGVKTGERVVIQLESTKVPFDSLDDLGMRPGMQEKILERLSDKSGVVVFSGMPATGLRSSTSVLLQKTDRFTREFMAIEDSASLYESVENIATRFYSLSENTPEDEQLNNVMTKTMRMMPDVLVMRDWVNGEVADKLCDDAVLNEHLIIGTIRAKDSAEAILRVLALQTTPKKFAKSLTAVLNQRLIRKLCDECKEAYAPTPQVLKQLGIPAGRVEAFYRPPQEPDKICPKCSGVGYYGRTAIFELLLVNDEIRDLIAQSAKTELIRKASRKAGMHNLQSEGIVLVAKGVTSLPELMRVMKQ